MIRDIGYHREATVQLDPLVKPQGGDLLDFPKEGIFRAGGCFRISSRKRYLLGTDTMKDLFSRSSVSGDLEFTARK